MIAGNWPFRIEIQVEDANGNQFGTGGADFVDPRPIPDLSTEHGISKWWMPLAPHMFIGVYETPKLAGVPPGKYRLTAKYLSLEPQRSLTAQEQAVISSKLPIFHGTLQTNSIEIEVLPKEKAPSKN